MKSDEPYFSVPAQMWHATVIQAGIAFSCNILLAFFIHSKLLPVYYSFLTMGLVAGFTLIILTLYRNQKPLRLSAGIFLLNTVVGCLGAAYNHIHWIQLGAPFQVFFGFKIMALLIGMLAPMVQWVGWASLAILFITPMVQYFSWTSEQKLSVGIQEPWFTGTVLLSSAFIYYQRIQIIEMIQRKALLEASDRELRKFAHLLLGAQHLINTPLQIIEAATELIRMEHPKAEPLVSKIEKSFDPIRKVSRLLAFGRQHLKWDQVHMALTIEDLEREIENISKETEQMRINADPHSKA